MLFTWNSLGPMFFLNLINLGFDMMNWLEMMNISIGYVDVSYVVASWITLCYVLVMYCWVIETWSPMKGKKEWMLVLPGTQVWKVNYLDSNDAISNVLLCWWQVPSSLTLYTWINYEVSKYDMIWLLYDWKVVVMIIMYFKVKGLLTC